MAHAFKESKCQSNQPQSAKYLVLLNQENEIVNTEQH